MREEAEEEEWEEEEEEEEEEEIQRWRSVRPCHVRETRSPIRSRDITDRPSPIPRL